MADIDKMVPHTGRFIGEDGQTHNIVDLLNGINQRFNDYATKQYVDEAIAAITDFESEVFPNG